MTSEELRKAYERFAALPAEEKERLDDLCSALSLLVLTDAGRENHSVIMPNRVSAMIAFEAAKEFEAASWEIE